MNNEDQSVGAKVKALLVRKGVDLSEAGFGVTNGVVTFTGSLCTSRVASDDRLQAVVQEIALARWLNRQLKRMTGVRDVVFQLDRVRKDGARFKPR